MKRIFCEIVFVGAGALNQQFGELLVAKDCKMRKHFADKLKRRAFFRIDTKYPRWYGREQFRKKQAMVRFS